MSVTNYQPKIAYGCRYSYDKLENVVYLVSKSHVKNVYIDNGEAYIDGLDEDPIRLEGFSIEFNEESSLDERYRFSKTVKFSLHGYVPHASFNDKYYVILKSKDGTKWMVNVGFPSRVTYTFNLNGSQYQTDFTFSSLSNFPTLRLASDIDEGVSPCKELRSFGIEFLKMLETDYCTLESESGTVHTYGKTFQDVEFLGQTCSLQEVFDGNNLTTTIQFNIAFDAYKSSWHYNLLEFLQNHYAAILKPKGAEDYFFSGFHFGLEPSFNVSANAQNGESDIITVTLKEASLQGSIKQNRWTEVEETETNWVYIRNVGVLQGWECVDVGIARFLLQQEINQNGLPTGRYKAFSGYSAYYISQGLNVVGEFSEDYRFSNPECVEEICNANTDIPTTITYYAPTCYTYSYSASCDWYVSGLADYMTVTPSSGDANSAYTLSVCNTKIPTQNETSIFNIISGNNVKVVNVNLVADSSILNPQTININCLSQVVSFTFDANCMISVTSIDSRLSYEIRNSILSVYVPRNYSVESGITWTIGVRDCSGNTANGYIIQDKTYEQWVDTTDYICESGDSYVRQVRYTGTTPSTINVQTTETRAGALIQSGDSRCESSASRIEWNGKYYCIDGDKYEAEEMEISYDGGQTWIPTNITTIGEMVEADSEFCQEPVEYKWVLTTDWVCLDYTIP